MPNSISISNNNQNSIYYLDRALELIANLSLTESTAPQIAYVKSFVRTIENYIPSNIISNLYLIITKIEVNNFMNNSK